MTSHVESWTPTKVSQKQAYWDSTSKLLIYCTYIYAKVFTSTFSIIRSSIELFLQETDSGCLSTFLQIFIFFFLVCLYHLRNGKDKEQTGTQHPLRVVKDVQPLTLWLEWEWTAHQSANQTVTAVQCMICSLKRRKKQRLCSATLPVLPPLCKTQHVRIHASSRQ